MVKKLKIALKPCRVNKGITLIELLIAMAISSLIIGAGYTTINAVTGQFNRRTGQVRAQNDIRLALHWLTKDLQDTSPEKVIEGNDPLYDIDGVKYRKVETGIIGSRKTFDIIREAPTGGKITLLESVTETDGLVINPVPGKNYYNVDIKIIDRFNNDKLTNLKISRRTATVSSFSKIIAHAEDDTITMLPPNNTTVDSSDKTWTLNVTAGALKDDFSENNLIINGLPEGLAATASKGAENKIIITVSGTAAAKITAATYVNIIVKSSAVTEAGIGASDPVRVKILPSVIVPSKIEVNILDDTIKMLAPSNTSVDSSDSTWILNLIVGSVKNGVSANDLIISGLPSGLSASAVKGNGNNIVITVSGIAAAGINNIGYVDVIVKTSAVLESNMLNSDSYRLKIVPGINSFMPGRYVLCTNEVTLNNKITLVGDTVIGGPGSTVHFNKDVEVYGNLYINGNLTLNNNSTILGKSSFPIEALISGSLTVNKSLTIHGILKYGGHLTRNGTITGNIQQGAVSVPTLTMPSTQSEQWYRDRGYIIIENTTDSNNFKLESGKKYYFRHSFNFNDNGNVNKATSFDDVIIAAAGDITFSNKYVGTGVIFAPNGRVTFHQGCDFIGNITTRNIVINKDSYLEYQPYGDLPF